jgi:hypothetical protein
MSKAKADALPKPAEMAPMGPAAEEHAPEHEDRES